MKKLLFFTMILLLPNLTQAQTGDSVGLLWEAETYTPVFYAGRALPTSEAMVRVVAMPRFSNRASFLAPESLIYTWQKDYQNLPSVSGLGKNTITYRADKRWGKNTIRVEVTNADKSRRAATTLDLPVTEPLVLFYEADPLLGTRSERALVSPFRLPLRALSLVAEPYYFSQADYAADQLTYNWTNNQTRVTPDPSLPRRLPWANPPRTPPRREPSG